VIKSAQQLRLYTEAPVRRGQHEHC